MIRRYFSQAYLSFKGQHFAFSFEEFVLMEALYPFLTLAFYCVLASYSFNTMDLSRWVVGNAFLLCVNPCIFGLGNAFAAERYYGRMRAIIVAPMPALSVVLQRGLFPALLSAATVLVGFCLGSLAFAVDFTGVNLPLFALAVVTSMAAATGFGLFLSVFGLITDGMHFVLNLMSYVLMIFCGANFPLSQLAFPFDRIPSLLPLTRGIQAAHLLFDGQEAKDAFFRLLGGEIAMAGLYFLLAALIIRLVERIAIKRATLEVF